MSHSQLQKLVNQCKIRNDEAGVSGLLLHSGGNFMQVLEGDDLLVSTVFARISNDPRHTDICVLMHKETNQRLFPGWGMQLANTHQLNAIDRDGINRVLLRLRLAGRETTAESQAIDLLLEFRRQLMSAAA